MVKETFVLRRQKLPLILSIRRKFLIFGKVSVHVINRKKRERTTRSPRMFIFVIGLLLELLHCLRRSRILPLLFPLERKHRTYRLLTIPLHHQHIYASQVKLPFQYQDVFSHFSVTRNLYILEIVAQNDPMMAY